MAMLDLISLPPEILVKIAEELGGAHKKTLRLVNRQLNASIERLVFSRIVLRYSNYQPDLIGSQLEALATGTTNAAEYATSLEIRGFSPDSHLGVRSRPHSIERSRNSRSRSRGPLAEAHFSNRALLSYLGGAVASLVKVQDVWWQFGLNDPEWAKAVMMDSLASLPALREIFISLGGGTASSLHLGRFSDLRKIKIVGFCPDYRSCIISGLRALISNSPRLTHLAIDSGSIRPDAETSTLHDLFGDCPADRQPTLSDLDLRNWCIRLDEQTLPHFHALRSLTLLNNLDPQGSVSQDLDPIQRADLLLRLGPYSSSNSEIWDTLRREQIFLTEIVTDEVSSALLDYLNAYSGIKRLTLTAATAHTATASDDLATIFYQEVLPRHCSTLGLLDVCAIYEGRWCFGDHNTSILLGCVNLESLKLSIDSRQIDRKRGRDTVWSLLKVSEELLALRHLTILSADSEINRGETFDSLSIKYIYQSNTEISKSVTTFGPLDPSGLAKVVTTPARVYVARADKTIGEGLWYRSSMRHGSRLEL